MRPLISQTRISMIGLSALIALLLLASSAGASYDPLGAGKVKLTVSPTFRHLLARNDVKLVALGPAEQQKSSYLLPVGDGSLDPTAGKGEIDAEGAIAFKRGRHRVPLRRITVKTHRTLLLAKVGDGQLKVARAGRISFKRHGFASTVAGHDLRLTAKVATRLSKKLRLHGVFKSGQQIGSLVANAVPATIAIEPKGRLTLTPAPSFLAKLNDLFVSLNPVAPAERQPGPIFTVPFVPAGTIAPDASSGIPRSGGSLEFLQLGSGQIFWHELWFDLAGHQVLAEVDEEPTPTFPGKLGQVPIAGLAPGAVAADPRARTVSLSAAPVTLGVQMAAAFNEAFAKPQGKSNVFYAGEPLGTLSFTAQTQ